MKTLIIKKLIFGWFALFIILISIDNNTHYNKEEAKLCEDVLPAKKENNSCACDEEQKDVLKNIEQVNG